jgi:hypothetical protein
LVILGAIVLCPLLFALKQLAKDLATPLPTALPRFA